MRYLCCEREHNTREHGYCPVCFKVPNPATQRIYAPRNERPAVFHEQERGSDAMDREEAERVAKRVELHLYYGRIDYARAALEEGWSTHTNHGGPVSLDSPLVEVTNDIQTVNKLDARGIITVRELLDTTDLTILSMCGTKHAFLKKVKVLKEDLRQRLKLTEHGVERT